ncbi:MAG: lysine--tRNA ligase [Anaerolineae bacterium]|nr:lysine--tRNA ligase [Anaerolineae bacterium]
MALSDQEQQRLNKLEQILAQGVEAFPIQCVRTHTTQQAIKAFESKEARSEPNEIEVSVTGRLRSLRDMGKSIFCHIEDGYGSLQSYVRQDMVNDEAQFELFKRQSDLGDFFQFTGTLFRTRTGEVTLKVTSLKILSKALSPLPVAKEKEGQRFNAFADVEARYRQRYADLAVNSEVRDIFRVRARVIQALRRFLDERGFLEVETPILQPVYGGAAARPFVTHHNQLHQDLYLRISFELYLKRLLVGMYERVYEIGRDFRNEGVSFKHNPEFTQLEFYAAYLDYNDVMELTEQMVAYVAEQVVGGAQITYQGHEIDLTPPWRRISLREAAIDATGIDYTLYPTAETLYEAIRSRGLPAKEGATWGYLVDKSLLSEVEPSLIQPTFVYDYPRDISPLAKAKPGDPTHVERFEFFIGGMECGNAFSELNDPLDQEQRFLEMGRLYDAEDDEAQPMDEDYLRAMRYGMPPCGGFGAGVDRLVMLFTDTSSIRDVLLFPHLRTHE